MTQPRILIVGAGIVGLAIADAVLEAGADVEIVDRDAEGDKASFGNAGGIGVTEVVPASVPGALLKVPGWMLDPLGPLSVRASHAAKLLPWFWHFAKVGRSAEASRISAVLASLNARVYDDLLPMLSRNGLSQELHRRGALTVYETETAFRADAREWATKRSHGIQVEDLTGAEARDMEPALGPIVQRGVFTPQWSHINDPKSLVDQLRSSLVTRGLKIINADVTQISVTGSQPTVTLSTGQSLSADKLVIAAGAWSGQLAKQLGDRVLLESERGYNTTLPRPGLSLQREVIFAERKFVATPLSCGLRIGGAAEFGGLNAAPNYKRSEALLKLARLYFPTIDTEDGQQWSGHRPTTPDSLPVIGPSQRSAKILYAFGHGHLGLTQAATTGRLIADLLFDHPSVIDLAPLSAARFA